MLHNQISPNVLQTLTSVQLAQIGRVSDWDLSDVRTRVMKRMGWSEELADEAVEEYRKFIALIVLDPRKVYGMVGTVDEVWHEHLLNTRDYMRMCTTVTGGMIHHDQQPLDAFRESDNRQLRKQTLRELARKFIGPLSQLWTENSELHATAKCCSDHVSAFPTQLSGFG